VLHLQLLHQQQPLQHPPKARGPRRRRLLPSARRPAARSVKGSLWSDVCEGASLESTTRRGRFHEAGVVHIVKQVLYEFVSDC
jgi:hypothetical protein